MGKVKTSLTIFSMFFILILAIGMVAASEDAGKSLENSSDAGILADEHSPLKSAGEGKHFEDVQSQINSAKDGDEIILGEGVYTPLNRDVESYNPISVKKSLNITGAGDKTVFNAQGCDGIFLVDSAEHVVFKNITFTGSILLSAVTIYNSDVDLMDCTFDSNQGSLGGALNVYADERVVTLNVLNCTFKNNGAGMGAAGVGGAMALGHFDYEITTNVKDSYFFNNIALRGGAIYVSGTEGKNGYLNIDNTTFEANRLTFQDVDYVEISGCDIGFWQTNDYTVSISNSNFLDGFDEENTYALDLLLLADKNIFTNNTFSNTRLSFEKTDAAFENCRFHNVTFGFFNDPFEEYLYESGPAPSSENLNYDISNCSFFDSSVVIGKGTIRNSGFDNSLIYKNSNRDLKIENCSFTNKSIIKAYSNLDVSSSRFDVDSTVRLQSIPVKATITGISEAAYNSGKKLTIKVTDITTGEVIPALRLSVRDASAKKTYTITTDRTGCAYFVLDTRLAVGTHNLEITSDDLKYSLDKITRSVKVTKAKTTVKAAKVTAKYKKSKYFKVTVKDKSTKNAVKNVKVKIKVDKKTFTVKTNSKGIAKINTKSLKVGSHKVVVSSGNSNYAMSAKSKITIRR